MQIEKSAQRPGLLLHSCCGPCSTAVVEALIPEFALTIFFYNPNITDGAEYAKRKTAQIRFVEQYNENPEHVSRVAFLEGEYTPEHFLEAVRGYEGEPEGGKRCEVCFALRLFKTAETAGLLRIPFFGTTLSVSPHKDYAVISRLGRRYGAAFCDRDFSQNSGYGRSIRLSKEYGLYRQNYCGCIFSKRNGNEIR